MTREQFARKIYWGWIIWVVGLVNVVAILPQLWSLFSIKNTEGLSVTMFVLYGLIQIGLTLDGYFKRNRMLFVCFGFSAIVSFTIVARIVYLRTA